MEEELHIEKHGSLRKSKRLINKRERIHIKKYLNFQLGCIQLQKD